MLRALVPLAVVLLVPARAFADQCAYVAPEVADAALAELSEGRRVVEFCEPCGQADPGTPVVLRKARSTGTPVPPLEEVVLDDRPIDLAYAFVETSPGRFENLARLAGCQATGVSTVLELEPAAPVVRTPVLVDVPRRDCERPRPSEPAPREAPRWPAWVFVLIGGILLAPAWALVWMGVWFARRDRRRS